MEWNRSDTIILLSVWLIFISALLYYTKQENIRLKEAIKRIQETECVKVYCGDL